jgi:uncharacterized protein (TIGR02301 family)
MKNLLLRGCSTLSVIFMLFAIITAPMALAQQGEGHSVLKRPYDKSLLELLDVLGALAHLEAICQTEQSDQTPLKDHIEALVESEGFTPERRKSLIVRFNQSFRAVASSHIQCTTQSRKLMSAYHQKAFELADSISSLHGQ